MTKKMLSAILALAMCLSLSVPAFAAEETEEMELATEEMENTEGIISPTAECNHSNKAFLTSGNYFTSLMSMGHQRTPYKIYRCTDCGKVLDPETGNGIIEAHTMKQMGGTGNNYHKAGSNLHFFEYEYKCTQCDYITTRWESLTCPGGPDGGCTIPITGVKPPIEIK